MGRVLVERKVVRESRCIFGGQGGCGYGLKLLWMRARSHEQIVKSLKVPASGPDETHRDRSSLKYPQEQAGPTYMELRPNMLHVSK